MSTNKNGDTAELIVAAEFQKRGYEVLQPFSNSLRFDIVLYEEVAKKIHSGASKIFVDA